MTDIGSIWWIQLILFIVSNAFIYGLIESWRYFPFIWAYITIIGNIVLSPFAILSNNIIFLKIKFFIISPVLIALTLWRIAYIPINQETAPKYKILIYKLSRYLGKYICCIKTSTNQQQTVNTTNCMEIFFWFVAFGNIIIAGIFGFVNGIYTNSICGILLSFTVPIPCKILFDRNGYFVDDGNLYDGLAPIHWLWIITFVCWDWTYVWHSDYNGVFIASFHLLPNAIKSLINKQYALYLQLRVFCLTIALWFKLPVVLDEQIPWFLNPSKFIFWSDISENHRYVFEIIGGVTLLMSIIHCYIFIKNIIYQRKLDKEKQNIAIQMKE